MTKQTTLHGFFRSGASYRVRIALNLKGLSFGQVSYNLRSQEHHAATYRALNPQGLVPALRQATEARLAGYIKAPQLDPGLETYIVPPGLGDEAGITGAIALGRRALGL